MDTNTPTTVLSGTEALQAFRKQYPFVGSGDLQTFTLGWQARDPEVEELLRSITDLSQLFGDLLETHSSYQRDESASYRRAKELLNKYNK